MGFWSTVLIALKLKSGRLPVVTDSLYLFRVQVGAVTAPLAHVNADTGHRKRNNFDSVQRVQVEAR